MIREKEKMLVTSIFYFSSNVFYPSKEKLSSAKLMLLIKAGLQFFHLEHKKLLYVIHIYIEKVKITVFKKSFKDIECWIQLQYIYR